MAKNLALGEKETALPPAYQDRERLRLLIGAMENGRPLKLDKPIASMANAKAEFGFFLRKQVRLKGPNLL
jgi:hypothetical protein